MRRRSTTTWLLALTSLFLTGAAAPPTDCVLGSAMGTNSPLIVSAFRPINVMDGSGSAGGKLPVQAGGPICGTDQTGAMDNNRAWNTSSDALHGLPVIDFLQLPAGEAPGMDPN